MACFIVPGTEAIVTTAITKIVEKKEKKEICSCETEGVAEAVKEEKALPFSRKLKWLNNMLWGGTALLAFEHVWHSSYKVHELPHYILPESLYRFGLPVFPCVGLQIFLFHFR